MSLARARSTGGWWRYSNREVFVDISEGNAVPLTLIPTIFFLNLIQNVLYFRYSYFGRGWGVRVAQLVEGLRYMPEGRGFDS